MAITQITIGADGPRVLLTVEGRTLSLPWEAADELATALRQKARQAEEAAKALLIAGDHAILLRLGIPLGLSNRPDIQHEAAQIAQYDRDLRRYLPGGVRSREAFGTPTITRHPAPKEMP